MRWCAVECLRQWLDHAPPRDPSLLRQAGLDEPCIGVLNTLRPAAVRLLRSYLHRLFVARALPPGNRSRLLEFLGEKFEKQYASKAPLEVQLLLWLESGTIGPRLTPWRPRDLSQNALGRFENAPEAARRLLFVDLQLRHRLGGLFPVPVPERSGFFSRLVQFFSEPPSDRYPASPGPNPEPTAAAPLDSPPRQPPPAAVAPADPPGLAASVIRSALEEIIGSEGVGEGFGGQEGGLDSDCLDAFASMLAEVAVKGVGKMQGSCKGSPSGVHGSADAG